MSGARFRAPRSTPSQSHLLLRLGLRRGGRRGRRRRLRRVGRRLLTARLRFIRLISSTCGTSTSFSGSRASCDPMTYAFAPSCASFWRRMAFAPAMPAEEVAHSSSAAFQRIASCCSSRTVSIGCPTAAETFSDTPMTLSDAWTIGSAFRLPCGLLSAVYSSARWLPGAASEGTHLVDDRCGRERRCRLRRLRSGTRGTVGVDVRHISSVFFLSPLCQGRRKPGLCARVRAAIRLEKTATAAFPS